MMCEDLRLIVAAALMIPAFCAGVGFREIFQWLKGAE
jgi:hypothetical protein